MSITKIKAMGLQRRVKIAIKREIIRNVKIFTYLQTIIIERK
jgi:hypothetical protein